MEPTTRSPTFTPSRPGPSASTVPQNSAPGENGSGGFSWYLFSMISVSKKFSAASRTRTRASPGPGRGSGTSSTTRVSGPPKLRHSTAFMAIDLTPVLRMRRRMCHAGRLNGT